LRHGKNKLFIAHIVTLRSHYIAEEASLSRFSYQAAINLAQLDQCLTILIAR